MDWSWEQKLNNFQGKTDIEKYFICSKPVITADYFDIVLLSFMMNSHKYTKCGTETKHRSGHNLLAVRRHKAAPFYSTSFHLTEFIIFIPK